MLTHPNDQESINDKNNKQVNDITSTCLLLYKTINQYAISDCFANIRSFKV